MERHQVTLRLARDAPRAGRQRAALRTAGLAAMVDAPATGAWVLRVMATADD
jgi:hypothetical protein